MQGIIITRSQIFFFAFVLLTKIPVQAQTEVLNEVHAIYIEELRSIIESAKTWSASYNLRQKIILNALYMNPQPSIPEEARKYIVQGMEAFKVAKSHFELSKAADKFKLAADLAPWLGIAYLDIAITSIKSAELTEDESKFNLLFSEQEFEYAIGALELYLLSKPSPEDSAKAKDLIYKAEFRRDRAREKLKNWQ